MYCPNCGSESRGQARFCKNCGTQLAPEATGVTGGPPDLPAPAKARGRSAFLQPRPLALAGAVLLFVGSFCPVVSTPFGGSVNYFDNGTGDGVITLFLALGAFALVWRRWFKGLWLLGSAAMIVCIYDMANASRMISALNNTFLAGGVQLDWGWVILILGCLLLLASPTVALSSVRARLFGA